MCDSFQIYLQDLGPSQVLIPYDPYLSLLLETDGKNGLVTILSHNMPYGTAIPIAYAGGTLSIREKIFTNR